MASKTEEESQALSDQDLSQTLRRSLSHAYAALLGDQTSQSFAAFTLEEALDAQIERIEGKASALRPNLLDRIKRIENETLQAVAQIKPMEPEKFVEPNPETDVNTPET
jgi:hypothetical protein